jgi:hypothetical protein
MLAGGVPGVFAIVHDLARYGELGTTASFLVCYYFVIPGVLAGIAGFLFGTAIRNPNKVKSAGHAAVRGLVVSLVAWLAFVPILSNVAAQAMNMSFLQKLSLILLFGSLFMGWLIAGVGIATGLLLYRLRKSQQNLAELRDGNR